MKMGSALQTASELSRHLTAQMVLTAVKMLSMVVAVVVVARVSSTIRVTAGTDSL
jgi:hypothetical protein